MVLFIDIVIRNLKQIIRTPATLGLIIGFPILFTGMFAFIFGGSSLIAGASSPVVGIINQDQFSNQWDDLNDFIDYIPNTDQIFERGFGDHLKASLNGSTNLAIEDIDLRTKDYLELEKALDDIKSHSIILVLVIPSNFSRSILSRVNYKVNLTDNVSITNSQIFINTNSSIQIHGDLGRQKFQEAQIEVRETIERYVEYFSGISFEGGNLALEYEGISSNELNTFDHYIPGFLVFAMIINCGTLAHLVGSERKTRTLDRLQISYTRSFDYLLGISFTQLIALTIQVSIMMGAAYFFGFNGLGNPFSAVAICILTIIPVLGMGLAIAAFDKQGKYGSGITTLVSIPITFLSGAFVNLPEIVALKNIIPNGIGGTRDLLIWDLIPFTSSNKAIKLILLHQYELSEVVSEIALLMFGGIVLFVFGTIFFTHQLFKEVK